jgi:photosystem II stability/assembly factor-like uncharacterized protein
MMSLKSNIKEKKMDEKVKFHKFFTACFVFSISILFLSNTLFSLSDLEKDYFAGLEARSVGPAGMSGRIAAIDVVVDNPRIIYIGAATGGIWKSINGGITWKPIFDSQSTSSIGDITIDPTNPEIIWVGTGESNPRNSAGVGRGIFKSLDGGESWKFLGLDKTERISRLLINPSAPNTAFVAAMGTTWGENPERGVFKTEDGGMTWRKILYVDEKTGAADLVMDPSNPNRLLAAMWEHRRWPWFFTSGGPGSGLYISIDSGESWKKVGPENGLPEGNLGRIGLAFSKSSPNIVYALVEAKKSALYRSQDKGNSWEIVNWMPYINPRPFYFSDIRVHPSNENMVFILGQFLASSIDGGKSFMPTMPFFAVHGDFQDLWIHPMDGDFMVIGGDGGIGISYDKGKHWNFVQNLPLAQYYHISVDMEQPYNVYGGLQDCGSWRGPSNVLIGRGIFNFHWQAVGKGDGFGTTVTPYNYKIGYSMTQGGDLKRFNIDTGETKDIRPPEPEGIKLRFSWNPAISLDPHNPHILYFCSQFVHKSTDEGQNWEIISPDLTTNNPEKQKQSESGGLTRDVTGAENHCTILTISPSPIKRETIWVGTDDGKIQLTKDDGESWTDVSLSLTGKKPTSVPHGTWIPHIEASHHDASTAYVVFDDHRRSNWTTYVFMTEDFGQTWKSLATKEIDGFAHVIREDPIQKNLLFLGTEFGLYFSLNRGQSWKKWTSGLPTVPIRDMVIHPRDHDLVIGTHGRSIYILDDIRPLQELSEVIMTKKLHLFSVGDTYQFRKSYLSFGYQAPGHMEFMAENRPYGALITYSIGERQHERGNKKSNATDSVKIEILDSNGHVVRTLKGPKKYGLNRINWDLHHSPPERIAPLFENFMPVPGPHVLPGSYTVRLKLDDITVEQTFRVLSDPRNPVNIEERREKLELIMKTDSLIEKATKISREIEKIEKSLDEVMKRIDNLGEKKRDLIRKKASELKEKLEVFTHRLTASRNRSGIFLGTDLYELLNRLESRLGSSFDAPTAGQIQEFNRLELELKDLLSKFNIFLEEELQAFIQELKDSGFSFFTIIEPVTLKK